MCTVCVTTGESGICSDRLHTELQQIIKIKYIWFY